jgi:hypothetical protein
MADSTRAALAKLGPGGAPVHQKRLALELGLISNLDKRPMYAALHDMLRTGEAERARPGVYIYRGRPEPESPEIREKMWAVLRMRRAVTIEDLQEMAGASYAYAREFLALLTRRETVVRQDRKRQPSVYRLAQDPGPALPEDGEKAAKLRALREKKKAALAAIDRGVNALLEARLAVAEIPET